MREINITIFFIKSIEKVVILITYIKFNYGQTSLCQLFPLNERQVALSSSQLDPM